MAEASACSEDILAAVRELRRNPGNLLKIHPSAQAGISLERLCRHLPQYSREEIRETMGSLAKSRTVILIEHVTYHDRAERDRPARRHRISRQRTYSLPTNVSLDHLPWFRMPSGEFAETHGEDERYVAVEKVFVYIPGDGELPKSVRRTVGNA